MPATIGGETQMTSQSSQKSQAVSFARRLGADTAVITRIATVEPTNLTYEQSVTALVDRYVAKWGEAERAASTRLVRQDYPTLGLALNRLASFDLDNIDLDLSAQAILAMTADDVRTLRRGG